MGVGTVRLQLAAALGVLALTACEGDPDLVGSVVQDVAALREGGVPTPGFGAFDAGALPPLPMFRDAGVADAGNECGVLDAVYRDSVTRFAAVVKLNDCEIPYTWLTNPSSDVDQAQLQAFLDLVQPAPRPGAVPEEQCRFQWGWYTDDPANPTTIIFCPLTCAIIDTWLSSEIDRLLMICEPPLLDAGPPSPVVDDDAG